MTHCPQCLAEYREGFTRCPDCDVDLVPGAPPENAAEPAPAPREFDPSEVPTLKTVFSAGRMEAEIVHSLLEANGIPSVMQSPGSVAAYPINVGAMGAGVVQVAEEDVEKARAVIESEFEERAPE